eukprot:TRINITY_DN981_c0_g1_i1.p1 TRINITY_DN981_c0_g1~~TRINITY_DN981_c0_g1_i1.p1  ORF type:complete len:300 (+),score=56.39 TRINITY_DN981_c0_g1_i1:222-1121(+)
MDQTDPKPSEDGTNWGKVFSMGMWFVIHLAVVLALVLEESEIKRDIETGHQNHAHAISYLLVIVITGALFVRTSTMNPGWISTHAEKMEIQKKMEDFSKKDDCGSTVKLRDNPAKGIVQDEPVDPTCRFCPTCNLWQKLRSKHCNLCKRCVAKYDHHCFWMGNCIGEKNHGTFWWFLFFESCLVVWTIFLLVQGICYENDDSVQHFLEYNLLGTLMLIAILVIGWLPMALLGLHTWLIITNQTTWEFNRRSRITYLHTLPDGVHPFSAGCMGNVDLICCDFDSNPKYWRGIANEVGKMP